MDVKQDLPASDVSELSLLRATLNKVDACIFTKDINGCYIYANSKVQALFGSKLEEIVDKDDSHFFDLSTARQLRLNDLRVMDHDEVIESEEHVIIKSSGATRIYWTVKSPLYNHSGEIIGLCGVATDITERKLMESELQDQKERLDNILNSIDAYVYIINSQRIFRYVNNKTAELLGREVEAIIGKKDTEVLPKEVADHFWLMDQKVFNKNTKQAGQESFIDAAGNTQHYWSVKAPIKLADNEQTLIGFSCDITELYNLKEELQLHATTDELTGLYNRRYFYEQANREFARSKRQQLPLSLLVIDIDLFKIINDTYGHPIGDIVLSSVASNCLSLIREVDILARVGGEEFAILLPNTTLEAASSMAERIRHFQACQRVTGKWKNPIIATISIGIATLNQADTDFAELFLRADQALYQAKQRGRNQVCSL